VIRLIFDVVNTITTIWLEDLLKPIKKITGSSIKLLKMPIDRQRGISDAKGHCSRFQSAQEVGGTLGKFSCSSPTN